MNEREIDCRIVLRHDDFVMQNHRVHGTSVMPGVTFLDIVLRILADRGADLNRAVLRTVVFTEAVATAEGRDRELRITVGPPAGGVRTVTASSRLLAEGAPEGAPEGWHENMRAQLSFEDLPEPPPLDTAAERARAETPGDMADMYAVTASREIRHGAAMKCFGPLWTGGGRLLAELHTDPSAGVPDAAFHLHPAKLDAATIVAYGQSRAAVDQPFIPMFIESFRAPRPLHGDFTVLVPRPEQLSESGELFHSSFVLYDAQGRFAAEFTALTCKRIRHPELIQRLVAPEPVAAASPALAPAEAPAAPAASPPTPPEATPPGCGCGSPTCWGGPRRACRRTRASTTWGSTPSRC